jgi:heme exporter protein A
MAGAGLVGTGLVGTGLAARRGGRPVFAGLSFRLAPGGALRLTGPNGSGKSTLLRVMAGLLQPDRGRIGWEDRPGEDDPAALAERIVYVGHQDGLKGVLDGRANLLFWASLADPQDAAARTEAALAAERLDRVAELPARALSAGQRHRLALARLDVQPAALWLLDEPATGLDAAAQARLEARLARHRAAGGMVALSTHGPLALPDATEIDLGAYGPGAGGRDADASADEGPDGDVGIS